jgi:hypothetical protein
MSRFYGTNATLSIQAADGTWQEVPGLLSASLTTADEPESFEPAYSMGPICGSFTGRFYLPGESRSTRRKRRVRKHGGQWPKLSQSPYDGGGSRRLSARAWRKVWERLTGIAAEAAQP